MAEDSLFIIGHGGAGSGKTSLSLTGPSPTLLFDIETASRFIDRSRRVYWNPAKGEQIPDLSDKTDPIVVVRVKNMSDVESAMKVLRSHKHPFKTVVWDSISEVIDKVKREISSDQFKIQEWGELGRKMGDMLREIRDLAADPDSPIMIAFAITMTKYIPGNPDKGTSDRWEPLLEGSIKSVAPYLSDMVAFIELEEKPVDPKNPFGEKRMMQTFYTGRSREGVVAKSRVPNLPETISDLTLRGLLRGIFGDIDEPEEVETAPEPEKETAKPAKKTSSSSSVPTLPSN